MDISALRQPLTLRQTAWFTLALLYVPALLRVVAHDALMWLVWANMLTDFLYLPAYVVLALGASRRHHGLTCASVVLIAAHLFWVIGPPQSKGPDASTGSVDSTMHFRMVTANLFCDNEHRSEILAELDSIDADVMLLQEYSGAWHESFEASSLRARYPHDYSVVRDDQFGSAIFSKTPMPESRAWDAAGRPMIRATVLIANSIEVEFLNVHTMPPGTQEFLATWHAQFASIASALADAHAPYVIAGDLNATRHNRHVAELRQFGLVDAHRSSWTSLLAPTFPNGRFPLPPIRLDQVHVSSGITTLALRHGTGTGSDHKPVIVDLAVVLP